LVCFFQAEDGIRDRNVTAVQTCALPISPTCTAAVQVGVAAGARVFASARSGLERLAALGAEPVAPDAAVGRVQAAGGADVVLERSEERREGKDATTRRSPHRFQQTFNEL